MYNIGEKVVHPTIGACTIQEITMMKVDGNKRGYYKLAPILPGKAIVYIPVDSDKSTRIRPVITLEDLQAVEVEYECADDSWIADNKKRGEAITIVLKTADFQASVLLIKMLKKRNLEKNLSYMDKKSLQEVQELVYSELAVVMNRSYEEIIKERQNNSNIDTMFYKIG